MHAHSINTQHITCITSSCETSFDSDQCFSRKQKSPPYTLTYICVLLLSNFSWPLVVISLWSEAGGSPQYTWCFSWTYWPNSTLSALIDTVTEANMLACSPSFHYSLPSSLVCTAHTVEKDKEKLIPLGQIFLWAWWSCCWSSFVEVLLLQSFRIVRTIKLYDTYEDIFLNYTLQCWLTR